MFPYLFNIGNFDIMTYYVMVFLGIIAGFITLYFNIKKYEKSKKLKIIFFAIIIFLPFITGARLGYIFECIFITKKSCSLGLIGPSSLLWGMILSVIFAPAIAKFLNLIVWEVSDLFAFSISIGGFFTRWGCFFNGCCFGISCDKNFPFGTYFPYTSYAGKLFENLPIHPTQLYLAFLWLIIFIFLNFYKNHRKFYGELFLLMAIIFSFFNFFIEFLRYHEVNKFPSLAQILSFIIFIISIFIYILFKKYKLNIIHVSKLKLTKKLTKD